MHVILFAIKVIQANNLRFLHIEYFRLHRFMDELVIYKKTKTIKGETI